jgi:hypothetical protein
MTLNNTPYTRLCPLCHKGFKSYTARELHIVSCLKDKKRQKQETAIISCRKCGKEFLMKSAASRHFQLCKKKELRGGMMVRKNRKEQLGVTQKTIDLDLTDLNVIDIADIIFENSIAIITSKLKKSDVKSWSIFEFFVVKNEGKEDEEIFPIHFNTGAEQIFEENFRDIVNEWAEFALTSLAEWLERGSGAQFLVLSNCNVYIVEYKSSVGKGPTVENRLPPELFKKGKVLNIINEPTSSEYVSCFHTCVCAYFDIKHERVDIEKKKTTRHARQFPGKVLHYSKIDTTQFESISNLCSPFSFANAKKVSKALNPHSYNIFKLVKNKAEIDGKPATGFHLVTAYLGKQMLNKSNEDIINLLLYKEHFYLILDLDNLVQHVKGIRNFYGKLCYNCLNTFDTRRGSFEIHQKTCSKGLKSNIEYCEPGTMQEFNRWYMLVPAIAYVVCDFESSLIPVIEKETLPKDFYKEGRLLHISNSDTSQHYISSFHTCVCAFYDLKTGKIDINKKRKTLQKIGKVIDYDELDLNQFTTLREISNSLSPDNLEKIRKELSIPFTIFSLIRQDEREEEEESEKERPVIYSKNEKRSMFQMMFITAENVTDETIEEEVLKLLYYENQFYLILDLTNLENYARTRKKCEKQKITKQKANHQVNSACAILWLDQNLSHFPYDLLKEKEFYIDYVKNDSEEECENLIVRFVEHLNSLADIITNWLKTIDVNTQLSELKKIHWEEFTKEKSCLYCQELFTSTRKPVFDHSHTHNRYNGASCSQCNLRASKQRNLSCFYHNASYDINLLLQHFNFSKLDEDTWSASMVGQKLKLVSTKKLEIRDSFALLPERLSELSKALTSETSHIQKKFLRCNDGNIKSLYPYTWLNSVKKFEETIFPSYIHFENDLGGETCTIDEYKAAKSFYEANFTTFKDYHLFYLAKDAAILADVIEYHRNLLFEITDLDLIRANSLPDLSYQALFYKHRIKKEVISDHEIYSAWEDAVKGGINVVGRRYTEVRNPMLERIEYYDLKSSYAYSMTRSLPFEDHRYMEIHTPEELVEFVHQLNLKCEGALMNIDCNTPVQLHDFLKGVPPVCEKRIFQPWMYPTEYEGYRQNQKIPKLINHLADVKGYYCIAEELILMLQLGIKVTKVNFVIKYKSKPFAKDYVEVISRLRAEELQRLRKCKERGEKAHKTLSKILKFLLNCVYGKFFLNKANYDDVCIVFDRETHEKKVKSFRFKSSSVNKYSTITKMAQKKVRKDNSPECAATITALGRVNLLHVYYNVLVKHFTKPTLLTPEPQVSILYIDTDCLCLYIRIHENDYNQLMKTVLAEYFDFSNLPENHILFNTERMGKIGILKYETDGRVIKQFIALCGKCYTISYFDGENITCKCKGIPNKVSKTFTVSDYIEGLIYPSIKVPGLKRSQRAKYRYIGVNPHLRTTYTFEVKKMVLNSLDSKRYIINDGLDSLPLGHYKTMPGERFRHYGLTNKVTNL